MLTSETKWHCQSYKIISFMKIFLIDAAIIFSDKLCVHFKDSLETVYQRSFLWHYTLNKTFPYPSSSLDGGRIIFIFSSNWVIASTVSYIIKTYYWEFFKEKITNMSYMLILDFTSFKIILLHFNTCNDDFFFYYQ